MLLITKWEKGEDAGTKVLSFYHNLTTMEVHNKCVAEIQTAAEDSNPCGKNPHLFRHKRPIP